VKNCQADGDYLVIEPKARAAQFRGVTDVESHPVPAAFSAISLDFWDAELIDA